jgi:hypothetical protein
MVMTPEKNRIRRGVAIKGSHASQGDSCLPSAPWSGLEMLLFLKKMNPGGAYDYSPERNQIL